MLVHCRPGSQLGCVPASGRARDDSVRTRSWTWDPSRSPRWRARRTTRCVWRRACATPSSCSTWRPARRPTYPTRRSTRCWPSWRRTTRHGASPRRARPSASAAPDPPVLGRPARDCWRAGRPRLTGLRVNEPVFDLARGPGGCRGPRRPRHRPGHRVRWRASPRSRPAHGRQRPGGEVRAYGARWSAVTVVDHLDPYARTVGMDRRPPVSATLGPVEAQLRPDQMEHLDDSTVERWRARSPGRSIDPSWTARRPRVTRRHARPQSTSPVSRTELGRKATGSPRRVGRIRSKPPVVTSAHVSGGSAWPR